MGRQPERDALHRVPPRHKGLSCHGCAGFPGTSATAKPGEAFGGGLKVLVAMSVFEPMWYVQATVMNMLSFTSHSTGIVLHFNANTSYAAHEVRQLGERPRVEVNCWRVSVRSYSWRIVLSQALNVAWAECRGARPQYVIFQASNMWWVRRGVEAHVRRFKASVFSVHTTAECNAISDAHRHPECKALVRVGPQVADGTCIDRGWAQPCLGRGPCLCKSTCAACSCNSSCAAVASRGLPPLLDLDARPRTREAGAAALYYSKHEGSFYPWSAVRDAAAQLLSTHLSTNSAPTGTPEPLDANLSDRDVALYRIRANRQLVVGPGRRYAEEWYFQSWVANFAHEGPAMGSCPMAKYSPYSAIPERGGAPVALSSAEYLTNDNDCGESIDPSRSCERVAGHRYQVACNCSYFRAFVKREPQFFAIKAHNLREPSFTGQSLRHTMREIQACL